jgi:hypothetical protein
MQVKICQVFLLCVLLMLIANIIGCDGKHAGDALTLQEAIAKGREALKQRSYSYWNKELIIKADDSNTKWNNYIEYLDKDIGESFTITITLTGTYTPTATIDLKEEIKRLNLKERRYWAIHYCPREIIERHALDGDAWVLIDRSDGKVIWIIDKW